MKKIFVYIRPYWKMILLASIIILFSTVCDLLLPTIMSDVLNYGIHEKDFNYIVLCCAKMLVISFIGLITYLFGAWITTITIAGFCADLRADVFRKVNSMSFEEFGGLGTAALVTRATHDVGTVSWVVMELSGSLTTIPILFFGGVILSLRKDALLSLLMLAFVPAIVVIVFIVGKKIVPLWEKSDEYIDKQNHLVRQRLRGIRVIRAFNAENKEHDQIAEATKVMAENIIISNVSMGVITPVATFLLNAATVLIVYVGGVRIEQGSGLSGGDVFAIVQYISLVSSAVIMGAFSVIMFPHAKVAAARIGQVLDTKGLDDPIEKECICFEGNIRLSNVGFSYEGAAEYALKNVSLEIKKGERIAIIGGTGAGKSTIVSLLLGFRSPTEGEIYFDDTSYNILSKQTMRDNISCVLQAPSIYTGSIAENVRMGDPKADDASVRSALEDAQALEFVDEYSDGIEHQLKQSGKNLSGGQKQRICIARALLKDAPIYIFDDSFSALDFMTEYNLRKALGSRLAGKTQIIITQRVSTAMHTDRIYVFDKGVLVGSGAHADLLDNCEVYKQIYASQTGGERP